MRLHYFKVSQLLILSFLLVSFTFTSCKDNNNKEQQGETANVDSTATDSLFFKLSLAEWSLNKPIFAGELDPMDFAEKAHEYGFEGLEYVTAFYAQRIKDAEDPEAEMQAVLDTLKAKSEEFGLRNLLLMVDAEGDLAANDSVARNQAVENHKKWVDAAAFLGCHSIRVNLFGSDEAEEWKTNSIDGLSKLATYAEDKDINILVENHGYLSSDADLLVEVMKGVGMENVGTLPDFGNFCLKREGGERWEAKCIEEYPRYEGVENDALCQSCKR